METIQLDDPINISLVESKHTELTTIISSIQKDIDNLIKEQSVIRQTDFINNSGCTKCYGRGWFVAWDTMDSLSGCYAEYSSCSCSKEDRIKSGLMPYYSLYDRNHGIKLENDSTARFGSIKDIIRYYYPDWYARNISPKEDKLNLLQEEFSEFCLENRISATGEQSFYKGDKVLIFKGRKCKNKVGTIMAYHDSNYGRSWIVKNNNKTSREDPGIWISQSNLTRIL
jgi:hypothetical protein